MTHIELISFGHLYGPVPDAELVADVRHHFRDPYVSPELRNLTGADQPVRDAVLSTAGIPELVASLASAAHAYTLGPSAEGRPMRLAIGCAGGHHRAPVVTDEVASDLLSRGHRVTVTHRDISRPIESRRTAETTR